MTWIKTVRMDEDDRVKGAMERSASSIHRIRYARPSWNDGETSGIVASHTLLPTCFPCFQHVWRAHVAGFCLSSGISMK